MEVYGAGGTQGPQPIYPRLAAFGVDAGQTVQAGTPATTSRSRPWARCSTGSAGCPRSATRRSRRSGSRSPPGVYETPEKLEIALDRLLDELSGW